MRLVKSALNFDSLTSCVALVGRFEALGQPMEDEGTGLDRRRVFARCREGTIDGVASSETGFNFWLAFVPESVTLAGELVEARSEGAHREALQFDSRMWAVADDGLGRRGVPRQFRLMSNAARSGKRHVSTSKGKMRRGNQEFISARRCRGGLPRKEVGRKKHGSLHRAEMLRQFSFAM